MEAKRQPRPIAYVEHAIRRAFGRILPSLMRYTNNAGGSMWDGFVSTFFGSVARLVMTLEQVSAIILQTVGNIYLLLGAALVSAFTLARRLIKKKPVVEAEETTVVRLP